MPAKTTSRRSFVAGLATMAAGAALAACGAPAPPTPTAAPKPTAAPAAAPPGAPAQTPAAATAATPPSAGAEAKPAAATAPAEKPGGSTPKPAGAPSGKERVTLRFHSRAGSEADALSSRWKEVAQESNIDVKAEYFPNAEYYQKMQTLAAGGQLGDVFWMILGEGWPIWAPSGVLRPLDDFVQQEKFDLAVFFKPAVDSAYYQGKLYGLPFKYQPGTMGIFYNESHFKESGAKEPDLNMTFDDLVQLSKSLTKSSGGRFERFGFLPYFVGGSDTYGGWWFTMHYVRAWGAELINEDGTKSLATDPKVKESVQWVHDLVFKHRAAPSAKEMVSNSPDQTFVAGVGAMYQSGSWTNSIQSRIKDKFQVKISLMPKGPSGKRGSMASVGLIGVNAKTSRPAESWQLAKYATDYETSVRIGEGVGGASGTPGARPEAYRDERLMRNPLHRPWLDAGMSAEPARFAANFRTNEYNQALWQRLLALWIGDEQPTDRFFADLNASLQQILDMPKP